MFKHILLMLFCLAVTACTPSTVELTSTGNIVTTQTETTASTLTYTPSPTLVATTTPTETPISTPMGGGDGILVFSANPFIQNDIKKPGAIYQVNSDGTSLKQILSPAQIETIIGTNYEDLKFKSSDRQGYIITKKGIYILTDDWNLINKFELNYSEYVSISSDFQHILWMDASGNSYITNGETGRQIRFGSSDVIKGWSADGNTIYFTRDFGRQLWSVNSDGSNKHRVQLDELIREFFSNNYPQRIDAYAAKSDKSQVAFTLRDFLFVAEASDLEFSNPRLITKLPNANAGAYLLDWSIDGKYLLIGLHSCENNTCGYGDTVLVNVLSGYVEAIFLRSEFGHVAPCGFSPDSKQVVLRAGNTIKLIDIGSKSSIDLGVPDHYPDSCVAWHH